MNLTKTQIQNLYSFTQKHYVDYYDVQTELVDHLANGIEVNMSSRPQMTFEKALELEFKKFGVTGFSDIVEQKTKALNKRYRKMVWKQMLTYIKLPKVILTAFLIYVFYLSIQTFDNKNFVIAPIVLSLFSLHIFYLYKNSKIITSRKKQSGRKWLFESTVLRMGGLMHVLNIGIYWPILFQLDRQWNDLVAIVFSVCLVVYGLTFYISILVTSPKMKEIFAKDHPEYHLID